MKVLTSKGPGLSRIESYKKARWFLNTNSTPGCVDTIVVDYVNSLGHHIHFNQNFECTDSDSIIRHYYNFQCSSLKKDRSLENIARGAAAKYSVSLEYPYKWMSNWKSGTQLLEMDEEQGFDVIAEKEWLLDKCIAEVYEYAHIEFNDQMIDNVKNFIMRNFGDPTVLAKQTTSLYWYPWASVKPDPLIKCLNETKHISPLVDDSSFVNHVVSTPKVVESDPGLDAFLVDVFGSSNSVTSLSSPNQVENSTERLSEEHRSIQAKLDEIIKLLVNKPKQSQSSLI